jgi:hypothetical protein
VDLARRLHAVCQGAIWNREGLDKAWQKGRIAESGWGRVVVGVDPSGGGDDVGIVAVAIYGDGAIVLEDATCPATSPMAWATASPSASSAGTPIAWSLRRTSAATWSRAPCAPAT